MGLCAVWVWLTSAAHEQILLGPCGAASVIAMTSRLCSAVSCCACVCVGHVGVCAHVGGRMCVCVCDFSRRPFSWVHCLNARVHSPSPFALAAQATVQRCVIFVFRGTVGTERIERIGEQK